MIVYDEVHRIKGTNSSRASYALTLGPKSYYRYVLTGTPIPNSYQDIFNFLNILYKDEYDTYFVGMLPIYKILILMKLMTS